MQNIVAFIKGVSMLQSNTIRLGYWKRPNSCRMRLKACLNMLKG